MSLLSRHDKQNSSPEMKKMMGQKLWSQLNGGRCGQGVPRGSGPFMILLTDNRVEMRRRNYVGMVGTGGKSLGGSTGDSHVHPVRTTLSVCPSSQHLFFLGYKNQVVYLLILNFSVQYTFVIVKK